MDIFHPLVGKSRNRLLRGIARELDRCVGVVSNRRIVAQALCSIVAHNIRLLFNNNLLFLLVPR
jgi:hypothetical protein